VIRQRSSHRRTSRGFRREGHARAARRPRHSAPRGFPQEDDPRDNENGRGTHHRGNKSLRRHCRRDGPRVARTHRQAAFDSSNATSFADCSSDLGRCSKRLGNQHEEEVAIASPRVAGLSAGLSSCPWPNGSYNGSRRPISHAPSRRS
jgi:hypothetical protein